jgi:hypothetical protein
MKGPWRVISITSSLLLFDSSVGRSEPVEKLSGKTFAAVEIAAQELSKRGLSIINYEIIIESIDQSIHIIFQDPNRSSHQRGSSSRLQEFEVELDGQTNKIIRSHFVK